MTGRSNPARPNCRNKNNPSLTTPQKRGNDPGDGSAEAEAPSHLSAGFLVGGGRYTLMRQIAKGGMGVVWLAHDESLQESVALKFLPSTVRTDSIELTRL